MSTYQGPWNPGEHPADWAYRTGRVTAESRETWRAVYDNDPDEGGRTIAHLFPVLADPALTRLVKASQEMEQREQDIADAEFAGLFSPTAQAGPADLTPYAHLFPPVDAGTDGLDEFAGLFPPRRR
ncbi:hypothetical protein F8271_24370 [Micromonospora sp. ALFpr18c]|uniref:hypothetical protein n=1 Tax=unclassified Micromonospora TaxID=2617518 RepID=UPI00124B35A2|nr:hypothetical protein [Micromonospora sp. ALFpr18c]KAB1933435.1 hypothetical protein F8271_24370 [Micromonospora sp. ALFpr18c]